MRASHGPSRTAALVGLGAALAIGLAFGVGVAYFMHGSYRDPHQGDPGLAALGAFGIGVVAAAILLPLTAASIYLLALRRTELSGPFGCLLAGVVPWMGAVAAFVLVSVSFQSHVVTFQSVCSEHGGVVVAGAADATCEFSPPLSSNAWSAALTALSVACGASGYKGSSTITALELSQCI